MAKLALCIGINDYPGTDSDLFGCVNDARRWTDELTRRGFAVTTLLNEQATRSAMLSAIAAVIHQAVAGDLVVITYSGHGTYVFDTDADEPDGFDEALCPHDVRTGGRPIVDDELHRLFAARADGVRLLLVADSCHSGTVNRDATGTARPRYLPPARWLAPAVRQKVKPRTFAQADLRKIAPAMEKAVAGEPKAEDDLLLAGCNEGRNCFSADAVIDGQATGAYTHFALQVLATLPAGASYDEWHRQIGTLLPGGEFDQEPQLKGSAAARARPVLD